MDQNVEEELKKLHDRKINYVQMSVDTLNEAIKLEVALRIESVEMLREVLLSRELVFFVVLVL